MNKGLFCLPYCVCAYSLMFGFMSTTAFLSMWISNTATTAMMMPILHAVLTQLSNRRTSAIAAAESGEGEPGPQTANDQLPTQTDVRRDRLQRTDPGEASVYGVCSIFKRLTLR